MDSETVPASLTHMLTAYQHTGRDSRKVRRVFAVIKNTHMELVAPQFPMTPPYLPTQYKLHISNKAFSSQVCLPKLWLLSS